MATSIPPSSRRDHSLIEKASAVAVVGLVIAVGACGDDPTELSKLTAPHITAASLTMERIGLDSAKIMFYGDAEDPNGPKSEMRSKISHRHILPWRHLLGRVPFYDTAVVLLPDTASMYDEIFAVTDAEDEIRSKKVYLDVPARGTPYPSGH